MPRKARLVIPGVPMHVVQRGNNRQACFFDEFDYRAYLGWLAEYSALVGCSVHAYVLMTNHVHLLLTPLAVDSAGQLLKRLGQRYVQYVNRRYSRSGTLWEGRFKSCLVEQERYLLACSRYIELNPVRAAMVAHPGGYHWSSYRGNAYGELVDCLVPHASYLALGASVSERAGNYRALFRESLSPAVLEQIRTATCRSGALGNDRFAAEIEAVLGRRIRPGRPGRPHNTDRVG